MYAKTAAASAIILGGIVWGLLAEASATCGQLEPLPADYAYQLRCGTPSSAPAFSVDGMLVRHSDDRQLRQVVTSSLPPGLRVDLRAQVSWDKGTCASGMGMGRIDGIQVDAALESQTQGNMRVRCTGSRDSFLQYGGELSCQILQEPHGAETSSRVCSLSLVPLPAR